MTIEPHAFYNCASLNVIDFSACDRAYASGIYQDNIELSNLSIIVKDELYQQQKKLESPFVNIVKKTDAVYLKELSRFENADILKSIYKIELAKQFVFDADLKNALNSITSFLMQKYNITDGLYNEFKRIFDKYNNLKEVKDE